MVTMIKSVVRFSKYMLAQETHELEKVFEVMVISSSSPVNEVITGFS